MFTTSSHFLSNKKEVRTWRSTFTHCCCSFPVSKSSVCVSVYVFVYSRLTSYACCAPVVWLIEMFVTESACQDACLPFFIPSSRLVPLPADGGAAADLKLQLRLLAADWQELLQAKHPNKIWLPSYQRMLFPPLSFFCRPQVIFVAFYPATVWTLQGANWKEKFF